MFQIQIHVTTPASKSAGLERLTIRPATVEITHRPQRVLDIDSECRPLHWIGSDYVSKELTAIAWAWTDAPHDVTCYALGDGDTDVPTMLRAFVEAYTQADIVTGHFLRGHDLPLINGALIEHRMAPLEDKFTHCTKSDLVRRGGISVSQENLGALLRLEHPKVHMNQQLWRDANRLTPEGIEATKRRVIGDVQQHIELRRELLELGYLAAPVKWSGGTAPVEGYVP